MKKVICLTTKEQFNTLKKASDYAGCVPNYISKACKGEVSGAGRHPETGEVLRWAYLEDYENGTVPKKEKTHKTKAVICLNTKEKFDSVQTVADKLGVNKLQVFKVCSGYSKTLGWSDELKEPLQWAYEKDVIEGKREYKEGLESFTSVICLTTGEVFETIAKASKKSGISEVNVRMNCSGKSEKAGIDKETKKPLVWRYWQEYRKEQKENKKEIGYSPYAVISLLTEEVFGSYAEAEKTRGLSKGSISRVVSKVSKGECSCTRNKEKNEKEVWMTYKDYLKLENKKEFIKKIEKTKTNKKKRKKRLTKIICLPIKKKFSSVEKAAEYFGIGTSMIYRSLRASKQGIERPGGKAENGETLFWMFEEDFIKQKEKNNKKDVVEK